MNHEKFIKLKNLKLKIAQKDQINCVKFSRDGKRFATAR